jgi:hypothetical protein
VKIVAILLALTAACASQDPALLVTISGQYRIPADADAMQLDVFDGTSDVKSTKWCVSGCALSLPLQTSLSESVTVVESGGSHPQVKLNVQLYLSGQVVGLGTTTVKFDGNDTEAVNIAVSPP